MPSGPKKRKTAKKKQEEAKASDEGYDERKVHNHDSHVRPVDGEDDGAENIVPSPSLHPTVEDHGVLKVENASESAEDSEANHVSPKHAEFSERSVDPSSSSNSSDDDSQVSDTRFEDKNSVLKRNSDNEHPDSSSAKRSIQAPENEQPGESFDLIVQTSSVLHSVPAEVPASEETIAMAENASTQNSVIADVITADCEKTPMLMLAESTMDSTSENRVEKSSSPPKGTEIPNSFENQPWDASRARAGQKTSFLSCCGLFDVVSSSDR